MSKKQPKKHYKQEKKVFFKDPYQYSWNYFSLLPFFRAFFPSSLETTLTPPTFAISASTSLMQCAEISSYFFFLFWKI